MPSFSQASKDKLSTCDPQLQAVMNEAIKYVNFSITCGYRDQAEQDKAFAEGKSQKKFPNGEHNKMPSRAVDVTPYPCDWTDAEAFTLLAGIIYGVACAMGVKLRLGADWDSDLNFKEHGFKDRPHVELL